MGGPGRSSTVVCELCKAWKSLLARVVGGARQNAKHMERGEEAMSGINPLFL